MANLSTDSSNASKLELLKTRLKGDWEIADYIPFAGFSYKVQPEFFYCEGRKENGERCRLLDSRIVYKYKTGSRLIISFNTVEEACTFWNENTKLNLFKAPEFIEPIFKNGDKVKILNFEIHERTVFSHNSDSIIGVVKSSMQYHKHRSYILDVSESNVILDDGKHQINYACFENNLSKID